MNTKLLIGFFVMLFSIMFVSAWPYQVNISNGVIYDLNSSNNATSNLTIYIYNNTYQNITYSNTTCFNCTYTYLTNMNMTNGTYYNVSEADAKFVTIIEFTNYKNALVYPYPSRTEFDNLLIRVNNLTAIPAETSHSGLWTFIIVGLIISLIALFLSYRLSTGGSYETL